MWRLPWATVPHEYYTMCDDHYSYCVWQSKYSYCCLSSFQLLKCLILLWRKFWSTVVRSSSFANGSFWIDPERAWKSRYTALRDWLPCFDSIQYWICGDFNALQVLWLLHEVSQSLMWIISQNIVQCHMLIDKPQTIELKYMYMNCFSGVFEQSLSATRLCHNRSFLTVNWWEVQLFPFLLGMTPGGLMTPGDNVVYVVLMILYSLDQRLY